MSASNSEASGEINQPQIAEQPQNQPLWDHQGWLAGDPYAPAFAAVQQIEAMEAQQGQENPEEEQDADDEEEEEMEEEEPFEEEEEEEPIEIEENEPEEYILGTGEGPTKEDDDLLSDAGTPLFVEKVTKSKYDRMRARYKRQLEEIQGDLDNLSHVVDNQRNKIKRVEQERDELSSQLKSVQGEANWREEMQDKRIAKLKDKMDTLRACLPGPGRKKEIIARQLKEFDEEEEKDLKERRNMGLDN